jgi:hypothetical protein
MIDSHTSLSIPGLNVDSMSANTFTVFPRLPFELRLQIWTVASREEPDGGPRTYSMETRCFYPEYNLPQCLLGESSTRSRPLPSLLAVCRDSRHAALQEYALFAVFYRSIQKDRSLYFHLTYDALVCEFPTTTILKYLEPAQGDELQVAISPSLKQAGRIRRIMLHSNSWWDYLRPCEYKEARWRWLRSFPVLEELTLIMWIPGGHHGRGGTGLRFPRQRATIENWDDIQPGTIRAQSAEIISEWVTSDLEHLRIEFPTCLLPKFKVVSYKHGFDQSSALDEKNLLRIERDYKIYQENVARHAR